MANYGTRRRRGGGGWLRSQLYRQPKPLWLVCVAHVLALGIALVLYALPHHVIPHGEAAVGMVSSRGTEAQTGMVAAQAEAEPQEEVYAQDDSAEIDEPDALQEALADEEAAFEEAAVEEAAVEETVEEPARETAEEPIEVQEAEPVAEEAENPETAPSAEAVGNFRDKFAGVFTSGGVKKTDNSYRSENISVTSQHRYIDELRSEVYVVDIYVADISCMMTAFSQDRYGRGYTEWITNVATRYQSVATINGDYYGTRSTGVIIRNGELYRKKKFSGEIAVLYWDGHMEAIKSSNFDAETEINKGAYQSWSFGPSLLDDDGQPKKSYKCRDSLKGKNPRSAIGYFEPGHYCFVAVDGRNDVSRGASLTQLATLMSGLGCKLAYNLDGGQTSLLALGANLVNAPSQGGRSSSDYIMVVDRVTQ